MSTSRQDGNGGFRVGDRVRTSDTVRPAKYAGQLGTVLTIAEVVPRSTVHALHEAGRTTNNGSHEIGVRFGSEKTHNQITTWFLPYELSKVGERP